MSKTVRIKFIKVPTKLKPYLPNLRRAYISASAFFAVVVVLLLTLPLAPSVTYQINPPTDKVVYKQKADSPFQETPDAKAIPETNRLVIPKAGVDAEIVEGSRLEVLNTQEGVWREPIGKNPLSLGNMTLAGHRYQYTPPNMTTFYNLDKLQNGDKILVYWEGQSYYYEVYKTLEVTPDQVEILNDSEIPHELTLYTCTPIYTSTNRLVVKAKMIS